MLDYLPAEVLELVLSDESIGVGDIVNVAQVCTRLASIVSESNEIWKNKFKQSFVDLMTVTSGLSWREKYKNVIQCNRRVHHEVDRMLSLYYRKEELPNDAFVKFVQMTVDYPDGYPIVVHELVNLITDNSEHDKLTVKYYAEKALGFIRQDHLRSIWREFINLPPNQQSIEIGAILVAQWFQPSDNLSNHRNFEKPLDELANQAFARLAINHPEHPLIVQRGKLIEDSLLSESLWSSNHCLQILDIINHLLYLELGFHGEEDHYYAPDNSYLNKVLEQKSGIPITLSIVYMSVARRLGVVCEPVAFPTHFFLRFCERPTFSDSSFIYIDAFNGGRQMTRNEMRCPYSAAASTARLPSTAYTAAVPSVVFERMVRNLVEAGRRQGNMGSGMQCLRYGLELLAVLRPDDIQSSLLLARIYLHLGINLNEVMASLQEVLIRDPSQTGIVAHMYRTCKAELENRAQDVEQIECSILDKSNVVRRPADGSVRYAVGLIMVHEHYNYSCVIFGWDPLCSASREWIVQMGVHRLANKEFQPFYNVLVEDGSVRYAAQDNLRVATEPKYVDHPDVGKYFSSYNAATHFVPNVEKRLEYPDDEQVKNELLLKMKTSQVP